MKNIHIVHVKTNLINDTHTDELVLFALDLIPPILRVGELKTRANKYSHIEYLVYMYMVTGQIQNRSKQKFIVRGQN